MKWSKSGKVLKGNKVIERMKEELREKEIEIEKKVMKIWIEMNKEWEKKRKIEKKWIKFE